MRTTQSWQVKRLLQLLTLPWFLFGCATRPPTLPQPTAARVVANIEFEGAHLIGAVPKSELANWWNMKLKIGSDAPDAYDFLITTNDQPKRIRVETSQQYTNAINKGAYALTTADMAMDSWFVRAVGTLKFMEVAQPSQRPLPDNFLVSLPVSLLGWHGSDAEQQVKEDVAKGKTLKDYVRSGAVRSLRQQGNCISFQTHGQDFSIEELARGDIDGDDLEDALLLVSWHYHGGSGGGYALKLVGRASTNSALTLIPSNLP